MVPQSLATGANRSCPEFWAVTDDPQYTGYKTSTVAPKPTIEQSVENVISMGGKIGSHMLEHFYGVQWWDCGAKASIILTGNPTMVSTMLPLGLCLG
jgi:hypothetical protein